MNTPQHGLEAVMAAMRAQKDRDEKPAPGGFPVALAHNAIMQIGQMYGALLIEQEKRIEMLSAQLGSEQQMRQKLTTENTELRKKLADRTAALAALTPVDSERDAEEDESGVAGDECGRGEGAEPV